MSRVPGPPGKATTPSGFSSSICRFRIGPARLPYFSHSARQRGSFTSRFSAHSRAQRSAPGASPWMISLMPRVSRMWSSTSKTRARSA
uniref:Uncharacterized protein n=1 Tax=Pakpunavirus sp. TaxID=2833053 RepID=A0AB39BZM2_9CAUD